MATEIKCDGISRRGFLGVVSAFTAAVASGVKMPLAGEPPLPIQDDLMASIRQHRVRAVQYEYDIYAYRPSSITVKYVYDPEFNQERTAIEDFVDNCIAVKSMRPVSITTAGSHGRVSEATIVFM